MILSHVSPHDLLVSISRTCKALHNAIERSAKLQRLLFRQPDHESDPRPFPIDLPGTKVYASHPDQSTLNETALEMTVDATKLTEVCKSSFGFRATHLTQPPAKHLICTEERINGYSLPRIELETHTGLSVVGGISFGLLMDYAEEKRRGWDETLTQLSATGQSVQSLMLRFRCHID